MNPIKLTDYEFEGYFRVVRIGFVIRVDKVVPLARSGTWKTWKHSEIDCNKLSGKSPNVSAKEPVITKLF